MPRSTRQSVASSAAVVLVAALIAYPLSYAPIVRLKSDLNGPYSQSDYPIDGSNLPWYQPVDWTIDNTPLRRLLFVWARFWGVETDFAEARYLRCVVSEH